MTFRRHGEQGEAIQNLTTRHPDPEPIEGRASAMHQLNVILGRGQDKDRTAAWLDGFAALAMTENGPDI